MTVAVRHETLMSKTGFTEIKLTCKGDINNHKGFTKKTQDFGVNLAASGTLDTELIALAWTTRGYPITDIVIIPRDQQIAFLEEHTALYYTVGTLQTTHYHPLSFEVYCSKRRDRLPITQIALFSSPDGEPGGENWPFPEWEIVPVDLGPNISFPSGCSHFSSVAFGRHAI